MGLTNQVRDFFTGRIRKALDAKEKAVRDTIATEIDISAECVRRLDEKFSEYGIAALIRDESFLMNQKKEVENKLSLIRNQMQPCASRLHMSMYNLDGNDFICKATSNYQDEIIAERFPEAIAELARIEKARNEIEGTILLATTEQKLILALTKVLERYGADLGDLKDVVGLE